jgi:hypothetical protein
MHNIFASLKVSSVMPTHLENGRRKIFEYAENLLANRVLNTNPIGEYLKPFSEPEAQFNNILSIIPLCCRQPRR